MASFTRLFSARIGGMLVKRDYVSLIEAIYAPAASNESWLQEVANAAQPCLDAGMGLNVYTYDARDPEQFRVLEHASAGNTPIDKAGIQMLVRSADPAAIARAHRPGPPAYFSQFASVMESDRIPGVEHLKNSLREQGLPEVLAVRGSDPTLQGCLLTTYRTGPARLSPRQAKMLARVGAHLASGWRLRQSATAPSDETDAAHAADAVFHARGGLLDARADDVAREKESLTRAIVNRARARGSLREADAAAAVALWQAMVGGEWTLVDHEDSDGKRFVLARRNRPGVGDPGALTLRERQVAKYASFELSQKQIGYELGLSVASVSEHLKSALRKLRLRNRAELIALLGPRRGS